MFSSVAGRTETLAEKVKVCNTCGDAGFDDCLAFCNQCNDGAEHLYCMVTVFDTLPSDWICEGCKSKQRENRKKRRLVFDDRQPVQARKKQVQNSFASPQGEDCLNKKDSFKNETEQIVTKQGVEAPSNGLACLPLSDEGSILKEKLLSVRDQPCFPRTTTQNLSSNIPNERDFDRIVASDVNRPAHSPVIPARNVSVKESLCSQTFKAVSTNECHNDKKDNMHKDLLSILPATCTVLNYQLASGIVKIEKEPSCLTEPVIVQDIPVISIDMMTSGERVENEKQGLSKTVATSLAGGKQLPEGCNVNKTVDFSPSLLVKAVATEKKKMEISSGSGKHYKVDHHSMKKTEDFSSSPSVELAGTNTQAIKEGSQPGKPLLMIKTDSKHMISITERISGNADAEAPMSPDILIVGRAISSSQPSKLNSAFVESESIMLASGNTTNLINSVCTMPPVYEASPVERINLNANKGVQNHASTSMEKPISNAQVAPIHSTPLKLEPRKGAPCSDTGEGVSAHRNAQTLTTTMSERIEKDAVISSHGTITKPQQATVNNNSTKIKYDILAKRSRSDACKATIRDFPIITKNSGFLQEGEKVSNCKSKGMLLNKPVAPSLEELPHPQIPGGILPVRGDTATGQKINGTCNRESQKSCGFAVKKTITQQETDSSGNSLKAKNEVLSASGTVEPPSLFNVEEKVKALKFFHKGGAQGSRPIENSCLDNAGLGNTTPPSNGESLLPSSFATKEPPSEILPMQENSHSTTSGAGMYKIPVLQTKRVAKRDLPCLKGQIGEEVKALTTLFKPKVVSPSEDKEQVTGNKSDADTTPVIESDVPANAQEFLSGKLKNASSSTSMRISVDITMPLDDAMRAANTLETRKSTLLPSSSLHKSPEDAECHGYVKQEFNATGLASCVPREIPSDGIASMMTTAPTNSRPALKRKVIKKSPLSPPHNDGFLRQGAAPLRCVEGPPCLLGEMEGVAVKSNSKEGDRANVGGGCHILKQKEEILHDVAASSQKRSSGKLSLLEGIVDRNASNDLPGKLAFTDKKVNVNELDHDSTGRDLSDKFELLPHRHPSRSQYMFNRFPCMMEAGDQPLIFELRQQDSSRQSKGAVGSSSRGRHGNAIYCERESEDHDFHARLEDAGCEPWNRRMGLKMSTSTRHHTTPGSELYNCEYSDWGKQDHYSRGFKREVRESSSYKISRSHKYEAVGHSREFCKADRQKHRKTRFLSDFDDRVSDLEHAKRECKGFQVVDGKKRWRYDPKREERFMNGRACVSSDADCSVQQLKRPPKASEYSSYDADFRYKPHVREEASFERKAARLETSRANGMQSEMRSYLHSKPSEYSRVHKRHLLRVQNEECCEADDTYSENGKLFPAQGIASSNRAAGPAGMPRSSYGSRLLPKQAPRMSQDQDYDDKVSQTHVPSQLRGSSPRKFLQERHAVPDHQAMWTGCFYVSSKISGETCYQGIKIHPSKGAHSKVFEMLLDLPVKLKMEERKRGVETDTWPRAFLESPPTSHSIGIYFFANDLECYTRWYKPLVSRLAACDFALTVRLDFAQLLIFPSQILPEAEQFWDDRPFLWGIFRRNAEESNNMLRQPSCRDTGSDLESPAGNGEVIDMDVDMVGGEDAVSHQLYLPLPPGFAPPPAYRP